MAAREILDKLDSSWYSKLHLRWMDLLGDYVGNELFLIDGDAICQHALNDPLLALGKSQECSFQLLHAVWSVEKIISEFVRRRCNFEIVFFERNEHLTLYGGDDTSPFVVSSRRLARTILKIHLQRLGVVVTTFESPVDKNWTLFTDSKQPMCMLCNDGSQFATVDCGDLTTNAVLLQRHFIFTMLSNGVAVVSLESAEFRGSKIISFVYEQNLLLKTQKKLVELMIKCEENALQFLPKPQHQDPVGSPTTPPTQVIEMWAQTAADEYFQSNAPDTTNDALFAVFLLHLIVLPYVSIGDRSQKPVRLHPKLESKLRDY
ncbi:hypothetical protein M407DRAFT_26442, partial [Tulasnella calospora MUT 4182]